MLRSLVRFQLAPRASPASSPPCLADGGRHRWLGPAARLGRGPAQRRRVARAERTRPALVRAVIVGIGAVGMRAARQLVGTDGLESLVLVDTDRAKAAAAAESLGGRARSEPDLGAAVRGSSVVVAALPGTHRDVAQLALECGAHVVSTAARSEEVRELLDLDAEARERALVVAVGAGFSPGLSCLLARHAATRLDQVDEIHVATFGSGGPACARSQHRSLAGSAHEVRDGVMTRLAAGSGRELCWFPDPIGGVDCYRAAVASPALLAAGFPGLQRASARVAATKRDRLVSRLRLPARATETIVGALRVEVRGRTGGAREVAVLGAIDRPGVAAGAVAAVMAESVYAG